MSRARRAPTFIRSASLPMMLSAFSYGTQVPVPRTRAAQKKLAYKSVPNEEREIPAW